MQFKTSKFIYFLLVPEVNIKKNPPQLLESTLFTSIYLIFNTKLMFCELIKKTPPQPNISD